jgi:hypothetical protein
MPRFDENSLSIYNCNLRSHQRPLAPIGVLIDEKTVFRLRVSSSESTRKQGKEIRSERIEMQRARDGRPKALLRLKSDDPAPV